MLFLSFSNLWTLTFSIYFLYTTLILSSVYYLLPLIIAFDKSVHTVGIKSMFYKISGSEILYTVTYFLSNILITVFFWSSRELTSWFNHIHVNSTQIKIIFLLIFVFYSALVVFTQSSYFSSKEIYDLLITKINFLYWSILLFQSNSLSTAIFTIETMSTFIFLLVITSITSTHYNYNNKLPIAGHAYFNVFPSTYLQSLMYYYWVSLLSSLNLFLFLLLLYYQLFSLEWSIIELSFSYNVLYGSLYTLSTTAITWFIFMFCIFTKCGIAPLYIWKPTFFKGIPLNSLSFYITFVYFTLFLFFITLLSTSFSTLFYFYSIVTLMFLILGLAMLLMVICESFYIKTFLAISSVINSLLVLLSLLSTHSVQFSTII